MGPDVTAVQYWQPYFAGEVDTGLWCYVLLSAHFATTKSTKLASAKAAERWGAPEKTAVQQQQLTDSTAAWLYSSAGGDCTTQAKALPKRKHSHGEDRERKRQTNANKELSHRQRQTRGGRFSTEK